MISGKKDKKDSDYIAYGANGLPFERSYWKEIYGTGVDVDASFNAREHAKYIKSLMELMQIPVYSLADFGFGKALLLKEMVKAFQPGRIFGIDPSEEMIDAIGSQKWIRGYNLSFLHSTIQEMDPKYFVGAPFDLGICNSVVQYIEKDELKGVFGKLHSIVRYLYFTVPTKKDYTRMKKEIYFSDPFAHERSKDFYEKLIRPYFRRVAFNLLESRIVENSQFSDEFFTDP
ncbi:methyltransferase domain protein [Leptospira broomii serovar Hurstbridge str. 5399]|uniref:Methyltransferase domain protein n=1 Tax=Leptospira broomii serovar Hurstbridge str. 5399 TaxID=1049789 RepID=T0GIG1_9LEPT|nr:class I SAM-dependent methyltransferase [Leptospira broomii]EQA46599.1 methyltransferase domain protein [Leptospira broomii serovar Hurstbridge str. 5399]